MSIYSGTSSYPRGNQYPPAQGPVTLYLKNTDVNGGYNTPNVNAANFTISPVTGVTELVSNLTVTFNDGAQDKRLHNGGLQRFSPWSAPEGHWGYSFSSISGENLALIPTDATNLAVSVGTNFTWECWAMRTRTTTVTVLGSVTDGGTVKDLFSINNNTIALFGTTLITDPLVGNIFKANTWHHIAITRTGTVLALFVDGQYIGSATNNNALTFSGMRVGWNNGGTASQEWIGYISNLRIVIGTSLYTTTGVINLAKAGQRIFTPSRSPLTAITNTKLLTLNGPMLRDTSGLNVPLTTVRVASSPVTLKSIPFSPFENINTQSTVSNNASFYSSTTTPTAAGASPWLVLQTAGAQSGQQLGAGDFTVECWVYPTAQNVSGTFFGAWRADNQAAGSITTTGTVAANCNWVVARNDAATTNSMIQLRFLGVNGTTIGTSLLASTNTGCFMNTWNHLAVTRTGGNAFLWVNGRQVATVASTTNMNVVTNFTVGAAYTNSAASTNGSNPQCGYYTGTRVVVGSAVYTSTFTPPSAPPTNVAGTTILLSFDPAATNIYDETGITPQVSTLTPAATTTPSSTPIVSTTNPPPGSASSILIQAASNVVEFNQSQQALVFGTGDFTYETWIRFANVGAQTFFDARGSSGTNNTLPWNASLVGAKLVWGTSAASTTTTSNTSLVANTWYHVAYVRSGGATNGMGKWYINGVMDASAADTFDYIYTNNITNYIGGTYSHFSQPITGAQLRGTRVSKFARYASTFTPPPL